MAGGVVGQASMPANDAACEVVNETMARRRGLGITWREFGYARLADRDGALQLLLIPHLDSVWLIPSRGLDSPASYLSAC